MELKRQALISEIVRTNADKDPTDSNVIIFRHFISFETFTASGGTAIHITAETMANIEITSLDIVNTTLLF